MHNNAPIKYKTTILSLIAGLYNSTELNNIGFRFSNTQYNNAIKKVNNNNTFSLLGYKRSLLALRTGISEETKVLINNYLIQNSRNQLQPHIRAW